MTDTVELTTTATIERVEVTWLYDEDLDLSYLEQECFNDYQEGSTLPDGGVNFGLNRIEAFGRGELWAYGIYAIATIHFKTNGTSHVARINTPGLWGIESDSSEDHFREVGGEELWQLSEDLKALGLTFDDSEVIWNHP